MIFFGFAGKLKTKITGLKARWKDVHLVVTTPGPGDDGLGYSDFSSLCTGTATEYAIVAHGITSTFISFL